MRILKLLIVVGVIACSMRLNAAVIPAQDPAVVNARFLKVALDNPRVRVMEATLKPGDREQMHSHPAYVVYVMAGGKVRNHNPDGTTSETTLTTGQTAYHDPVTHWSENIGTTTIHTLVIELKSK